jgi:hypothetical protein
MRYALAVVLAGLIGVSGMIQGALAAEKDTPQMAGSTMTTQYYGPSGSGTVAGPMAPSFQWPIVEHGTDNR